MTQVINGANLQPLGDTFSDFIYLYSDVDQKPIPGQFIISGGGLSLNGLAGTMTLAQDTMGYNVIDVDSSTNPLVISPGCTYRTVDDGVQVVFNLPAVGSVSFGCQFKILGQGAAGWKVQKVDPIQSFEIAIYGYNISVAAANRYSQATIILNYNGPTSLEAWRLIEIQGGIVGT